MSIKKFVAKDIAERKDELSAELESIKQAEVVAGADITFKVGLHSLWSDHGEIDIEGRGKTLSKTIQTVETEFMSRNSRQDVQAKYYVWACTAGLTIMLPEKFWKKYVKG